MMRSQKYESTTLVETMLYLVIMSIILGITSAFFIMVVKANAKNQVITEVEAEGQSAMDILTSSIRNCETVDNPARTTTSSTLNLTMPSGTNDFSINGGRLLMEEGPSTNSYITSTNVTVTRLEFTNLGTNTIGSVHIEMDITYNNPTGKSEYNYTKTFYGGASDRL